MSTLPTREQLEAAISPWWSGGGRARKIVDILRKSEANIEEAERLGERMAVRANTGLQFITDETIEEQLEMVRASHAVREQRTEIIQKHTKARASAKYPGLAWDDKRGWVRASSTPAPPEYDPNLCVYVDGVKCWQCSKIYGENIVHGHLLSEEEVTVRLAEIRQLLVARDEEKGLG